MAGILVKLMGNQVYRKRHKELGLCVSCTREVAKGFVLCKFHLMKNRAFTRDYQITHYTEHLIRGRRRYKNLVESNRCVRCGAPLMEEEKVECINCSTKYGRWRV